MDLKQTLNINTKNKTLFEQKTNANFEYQCYFYE